MTRAAPPATLPAPASAQMAAAPEAEEKIAHELAPAGGARGRVDSLSSAAPIKTRTAAVKPARERRLSKLAQDSRAPAEADFEGRTHEAASPPANMGFVPGNAAAPADPMIVAPERERRDKFDARDINPVKQVAQEPVSTFSIDVDTASYAFARRALNAGQLPPKDSVRVEEFINYFPYNYPKPDSAERPFQPTITVTPSPWSAGNRLVHVAVQGYALQSAQRPRANLVFLIDVSGSMAPDDRLPLVKHALRMLVDELKPEDSVAIVTYASGSGVALEPTKIADKHKILAAIDALGAGGSTAGARGIQDAYRLVETNFDKSAVNRVILATDGDFNVGITDQGELKGLIERKREKGIFLSILGVGQGNYNDALMQTLAQNGNGIAAYIDTLSEAEKVLVQEATASLFTIAKDVKIQVEFNPARVSEYRLIGYETRALRNEDFNNDRVDAGDIGSGHTVTAIYEM
ncbi:MAG: VWA domain-containing protein, partial [Methylocystis sp.]|nr:VWA domain-containing protein [Methylocystis sp.]